MILQKVNPKSSFLAKGEMHYPCPLPPQVILQPFVIAFKKLEYPAKYPSHAFEIFLISTPESSFIERRNQKTTFADIRFPLEICPEFEI